MDVKEYVTIPGFSCRLGNHLFQIASVMGYSSQHQIPVLLPSWKHEHWFPHVREFCTISPHLHVPWDCEYHGDLMRRIGPRFSLPRISIRGFCQQHWLFDHCVPSVRAAFRPNENVIAQVKNRWFAPTTVSFCGVHVRRGDLKKSRYPIMTLIEATLLPLHYYEQAMKLMTQREGHMKFYVCSDDLKWCKKAFAPLCSQFDIIFANGGDPIHDFVLLSLCDHQIIANSSFSWWAAYLNLAPERSQKSQKQVIYPIPWRTWPFFDEGLRIQDWHGLHHWSKRRERVVVLNLVLIFCIAVVVHATLKYSSRWVWKNCKVLMSSP